MNTIYKEWCLREGVNIALGITISFDLENGVRIGGIQKTIRKHKGKSLVAFIDEYVVLDLETTGFDPTYDEIIEVGTIKYSKGERVSEFATLVKTDNIVDEYITQLTGITIEMKKFTVTNIRKLI